MDSNWFSYVIPSNFRVRVAQFLQQMGKRNVADAFLRCKYEHEDLGLAYYAGMRGDNWDKHAVDVTLEGLTSDIMLLKASKNNVIDAIGKALKPTESGFLIRNLYLLEADFAMESVALPASNEMRLKADIKAAEAVLSDLLEIGERLCINNSYNSASSENSMNDYFRDMLSRDYKEVKDQTRHGISEKGKDAGEVDILLSREGKEVAIFEGLKLDSVKKDYIGEHIDKAIVNYNALGTPTFVVAYVSSVNFGAFADRFFSFIENYAYPITVKTSLKRLPAPNAAAQVATMILTRDGYDFPVYFLALNVG